MPQVEGPFTGHGNDPGCLQGAAETHTVPTQEGRIPSFLVWVAVRRAGKTQACTEARSCHPPARWPGRGLAPRRSGFFIYQTGANITARPECKENTTVWEALAQGMPHLKLLVFKGLQTQVLQTLMEEIKPKNRRLN